ncbi:MAG: DUF222 domain-containing protein [Planctomycetes bacterium]|nr:DUF222 domain-containing protein [Planctomycetota bacterium]
MGLECNGDASAPALAASTASNSGPPEKRRLERNLRAAAVISRVREAERRMEAGERELGFYLLELQRRKLYRSAGCSTFNQFIRLKTGMHPHKAADLVRAAKALESLPSLDEAFAKGQLFWSAVRAITSVATPQTDADWVRYALGKRVDEIERRVAACCAFPPRGRGR